MRKPPALEELRKANEEAQAKRRALLESARARKAGDRIVPSGAAPPEHGAPPLRASRPTHHPTPSAVDLRFFSRAAPQTAHAPQPWTSQLIDIALRTAVEGCTTLCLVWPARWDSIAPIHTLASLLQIARKDLRGVRTILFPGNQATQSALSAWLVDRQLLANLYRALWISTGGDHQHSVNCAHESKSMLAVLACLNDIHIYSSDLPSPSLTELTPIFLFEPERVGWRALATAPLERTLRKVSNLRYREQLRDRIGSEWGDPEKAPSALLIVHGSTRKEGWKKALRSMPCSTGATGTDLLLFDATAATNHRDPTAVGRIAEFLKIAHEGADGDSPALIVTDDPVTFFALRGRIQKSGMTFQTRVFPAEADQVLLAAAPLPTDWQPKQKSNSRFSVGIVDRDAATVALAFQTLAAAVGSEGSPGRSELMEACLYILRLSNLPAGYVDLTALVTDPQIDAFSIQRNAWSSVEYALGSVPLTGAFAARKHDIDAALDKARKLIDLWTAATPMAVQLQTLVRRHAVESRRGLIAVLPNQRYIALAHRFLARTLGEAWEVAERRLEWHTLATIGKRMRSEEPLRPIVFVGVNRTVLRTLLGNADVPHGTHLLIAYRQAASALTTLTHMMELEELKAYRGRVGLLMQELERRIEEIPKPIKIEQLRDLVLTFPLDDGLPSDAASEQRSHKFQLEGGGCTYRSGWVYRYEGDEDPPFRRVSVSAIEAGDLIFEMSDSLRAKIESALQISGGELNSVVEPGRAFLRLYHDEVRRRCATLFPATKRSTLARQIHARMLQLDPAAANCERSRVYYWLDIEQNDSKPHAARNAKYFKLFCDALGMPEQVALNYWNLVRNARVISQSLGRALAAQYAEILFQPASAMTYRQLAPELIYQLQNEALRCVFRVVEVLAPSDNP